MATHAGLPGVEIDRLTARAKTTRAPAPAVRNAAAKVKAEKVKKAQQAEIYGVMLTDAALTNAFVAAKFGEKALIPDGSVDVLGVADAITLEIEKVKSGDLTGVEAMLIAQAIGLQNIYAQMITRAATTGTAEALNVLGGLGLRAQAQSRATLQTLIDLKFPRSTVFAKNANVANGHQQVNIGAKAVAGARAHEAKPPIELLNHEATNVLVPRTPRAASRSNSKVEAVAGLDRAAIRRGQICDLT